MKNSRDTRRSAVASESGDIYKGTRHCLLRTYKPYLYTTLCVSLLFTKLLYYNNNIMHRGYYWYRGRVMYRVVDLCFEHIHIIPRSTRRNILMKSALKYSNYCDQRIECNENVYNNTILQINIHFCNRSR